MLTWISEQAKWVIYISIVFILAGLLFMDMSQLQTDRSIPAIKVDGEPILLEEFQTRLQQAQRMQAQQGASVSESEAAQLRRDLFNQIVQERLLNKELVTYNLEASVSEMQQDLLNDPPAALKRAPAFMTDSVFDQEKYKAWLATDSIYDDPGILEYETYLKNQKVPLKQMQLFLSASNHPTTLEARYQAVSRETKYDLVIAYTSVDSFAKVNVDSAEVKAYFEAHPDSFRVEDDQVQFNYVALPIQPSQADEKSAREYAVILINQLKDGADFAEIVSASSEDPSSNQNQGEIDPKLWGKEFIEALQTLDSGAFSPEPVRTSFGWHVIQSLGSQGTGDSAQIKARHILVKITATSETVDSLQKVLEEVREAVNGGQKFEDVAAEKNLPVQTSPLLTKNDQIPGIGYVAGLKSFLFRNPELPKTDEVASQVLQNKDFVILGVKGQEIAAGTPSLEKAFGRIQVSLANEKGRAVAADYLKSKLAEVQGITEVDSTTRHQIAKVVVEKITGTSTQGFVPGLGYASSVLHQVLSSQKVGEWGPVVTTNRGAAVVQLTAKQAPEEEKLNAQIEGALVNAWNQGAFSLFSDYLKNLKDRAEIVDNLDLYFSE